MVGFTSPRGSNNLEVVDKMLRLVMGPEVSTSSEYPNVSVVGFQSNPSIFSLLVSGDIT